MATSTVESRHLSTHIDRPVKDVYDYASAPSRIIEWAPGLGSSIEQVAGRWVMESPMGRIVVEFTSRNDLGVLDHYVTLPSGDTVYNPFRVIADGDGAEAMFTVRRQPTQSDEEFARDIEAVSDDLANLKRIVESA